MGAVFSAIARDLRGARGVQAVYRADNSGWTTLSTGVEKIVDNMIGLLPQSRKRREPVKQRLPKGVSTVVGR